MSETLLDTDSSWPKSPSVQMPANPIGRDWLVGDLHGAYDLLKRGLEVVKFDASRDRLFCLGDMIDRGTQGIEVLRLSREPWFHVVRGNHEQACLDLHASYTLENNKMHSAAVNYGARVLGETWLRKLSAAEQVEVIHLLIGLPVLMTVETPIGIIGLVHAEVPAQCSWSALEKAVRDMPKNLLVCNASISSRRMPESLSDVDSRKIISPPPKVEGVERVYHGHVSLRWPFRHENRFYIDTGAWMVGKADAWSGLTLVQLGVGDKAFDRQATSKPIDGVRIIANDALKKSLSLR